MNLKSLVVALGIASFSTISVAGEFQEGYEAAVNSDFKKAASIWQNLAEQGNPDAQFNLAMVYHSGSAGYMNEKEALKWYHKAASNGHYRAQEYLVVGYREGWFGLEPDESKARFWETKLNQ